MFRTAIARALLVAALVLPIASGTAAQDARPTPEGTRWHLVASDAGGLEGPTWPWDLEVTLTLGERRAFGSAGCNGFGADYELDGEALSFGPPRLSNADCADATMGIEAAYMAALPKTVWWGFDTGPAGDRLLLLFDVDDELLLSFTEADIVTPTSFPGPEGGPWLGSGPLGDFTHVPGAGATQGLDWQPAAGPALEQGASLVHPTAWAGGFAVVERPRNGDKQTPHAVRTSADGRSWERTVLPEAVRYVYWLRPFRDGLVLVSAQHRGYTPDRFRLDTWRSVDGLTWRRVGSVAASLPERLKRERYWSIVPVELIATDRGLTLLASVVYSEGAGGSSRDATIVVSGGTSAPVRARTRPARIWGWTSRDGSEWDRRRVGGVVGPDGYGFVNVTTQAPSRILAIRGNGDALLSSRDGLRWRVEAPLPSDFEGGVSEALLWTADGALVLGDNGAEGGEACGNRLGAWRLDQDGTWVETLDRQPAVAKGAAADGATVLVAGKSWCAGEWAWVIGSADGGRTWDPDLSWIGPLGSCRGEMAIADGTAVVVDCAAQQALLWAAVPTSVAAP